MRTYALTPLECGSVQAILSAVLNEKSPVDRATAQEFKMEPMPEAAQIHVIGAVGDILRHLNLLAFLAGRVLNQNAGHRGKSLLSGGCFHAVNVRRQLLHLLCTLTCSARSC